MDNHACIYLKKGEDSWLYSINSCGLFCSSVGMCRRCGDVRLIACSRCKGSGLINEGGREGQFNFNLVGGGVQQQSFRAKPTKTLVTSVSCTKCQARGHFCCPICSKLPDI